MDATSIMKQFASNLVVFVAVFCTLSTASVLRLPEFAEPIKNVTLNSGSDVEFSCDVRHLGTYRVTWSWKKDDEQKFLAIGIVKITHNQRVHISKIQKSDEVTQFNLYVYNIRKDDEGVYYCSVNSNPMIEQIGTLEVVGDTPSDDYANAYSNTNGKLFNGQHNMPLLKEDSTTRTSNDDANVRNFPTNGNSSETSKNSTGLRITQNEDSTVVCIDLGEVWEGARERISEFFQALIKFSYSYWLS